MQCSLSFQVNNNPQKGALFDALMQNYTSVGLMHSCLQSCVGTRARLGYAAFDAQLRKAYFVTTLYAKPSVHAYAI